MQRLYQKVIEQHFNNHNQMLFLAGPRQVGKTTLVEDMAQYYSDNLYLNFDKEKDRLLILQGESAIIHALRLDALRVSSPVMIFDEIHKYKHWKNLLKGMYDEYKKRINIVVTGSAKLDIYKKGGDSLMGRYFLYHIHPLSVAEILNQPVIEDMIHNPKPLPTSAWQTLMNYGGYPEPYLKNDARFSRQWHRLRRNQLFHEEIRTLSQIQDIPMLEMLAQLLREQGGQLINYSALAVAIRVSVDTVIRWIGVLESFYYCFRMRPWYKNVKRSLVKEPKIYLWDWSEYEDEGTRFEGLIACHLHKAVQFWTDYGLGEFELYFLRDKEQREVDFLVVKNHEPWFLVEAKLSGKQSISKALYTFQQQLGVPHAFQVAADLPYIDKNCFDFCQPIIVPALTFLSQLI